MKKMQYSIKVTNTLKSESEIIAKVLRFGDAAIILKALQDAAVNSQHIKYEIV